MKQSVLDALHGIQLWGIVRSDTGGRCGRNDEFLAAFKRLEEEVSNVEKENAKLRELVNSYADLFEKEAATNNGYGPYYSGEDWLALANDMRIELAECCDFEYELGIEVS